MATVFISYNRQSEATTKALADDIEALGHNVWFDKDVSGGQAWWDQILSKVRDSDIFVFVLDTEALNSTACKREYGYAAELGKPILPILASSDVSTKLLPPALSKIQFVDYLNADREAAFRLARALTSIPPPTALPDPLPTPPEAPISYLGNLAEQVESTSTLNYEKQSALLLDLRRGLRDPNTADDVQGLLKKFRKRNDLLVTIAEEIDELIKDKIDVAPPVSMLKEIKPSHHEESSPHQMKDSNATPKSSRSGPHIKPTFKDRIIGGCLFICCAAVLHLITWSFQSSVFMGGIAINMYLPSSLFHPPYILFIIASMIAGAVSRGGSRGIKSAIIGTCYLPIISVFKTIGQMNGFWAPESYPTSFIHLIHPSSYVAAAILTVAGSIVGIFVSRRKARVASTTKATA